MSTASTEPQAVPRRRRRRWLWMLVTLVSTAILFEATLRVLVYSDLKLGNRMRMPRWYADSWSDPFYFQLLQRWSNEPGALSEKFFDPRLGWIDPSFDRESFVHDAETELDGRRPVLLFGDSYTRCMTDEANCFQGWLDRSPAGSTHAILNYGVRAYGIDQVAILARLALEHWRDRNALVAIGIFMEDDLDRAVLDYRGWPKPRFTLASDGALVEPLAVGSLEQYDENHPLWTRGLAWRWLVHGSDWLPTGLQRKLSRAGHMERQKQRLCGPILERLEGDLQALGIEHFYVLFPGPEQCETLEPSDWRENFLLDWLDSHHLPYVNVKRELIRAALDENRKVADYFGRRGALADHLTPDGNEIAFRALLRGIEGRFDRSNGRPTPHFSELRDLDGKESGRVRIEQGWSKRFPEARDRERIIMVPTAANTARIGCVFSRPAKHFSASARVTVPTGSLGSASVRLEIRVNRLPVRELVLDATTTSAELDFDVFGRENIEIVATRQDTQDFVVAVVLSRPHFE